MYHWYQAETLYLQKRYTFQVMEKKKKNTLVFK